MEGDDSSKGVTVEPIENLLKRKYVTEKSLESELSTKYLIPIPEAEEPLVDMFEDENYVKIFLQCHCNGKDVKIRTDTDNTEILVEECRKLTVPVRSLNIENMAVRCNNTILEIAIPKIKATSGYSN